MTEPAALAVEAAARRNGWDAEEDRAAAQKLVLQRNGVEALGAALAAFRGLVSLDVSRNKLVSLEGLEHLVNLETLNVYLNRIDDGRQLLRLRHNTALRKLDVRLNPVVRSRLYRSFVIQHLPDIDTLDEQTITALERRKAAQLPPIAAGDLRPNLDDDDEDEDDSDYDDNDDDGDGEIANTGPGAVVAGFAHEASSATSSDEDGDTVNESAHSHSAENALAAPVGLVQTQRVTDKENRQRAHNARAANVSWEKAAVNGAHKTLSSSAANATSAARDRPRRLRAASENGAAALVQTEEDEDEVDDSLMEPSTDQILLELLRHMRALRMPVSTTAWEDTVASVNERLVRLVQARKSEKQTLDAERRATNESLTRAEHERLTQANTERALREQLELLADRCTALEHEKAALAARVQTDVVPAPPSPPTIVKVDDEGSKALAAMLRESHEALLSTNETLREQLREAKEQHEADEAQWQRNFDHLRRTLELPPAPPTPLQE